MHGTYVGRGRMLTQPAFGAKIIISADDLFLMPSLVCEGVYDGPFTAYLQRSLQAGNVVVDVGANVGLFTLLMAWQVGPTGAVIAYEPEPRNLTLLRENVALNYVEPWVEVRSVAAGRSPASAMLHRSSRFTGYHSLLPFDAEHIRIHDSIDQLDQVEVRVEPLDALVGRFERIDLIKVDVEGFEADVLRGATQLVASGVARRFSVEVNRARAGSAWGPFATELRALGAAGWTFALIDDDGTARATDLAPVLDHGRAPQLLVERL